MIKGVGRAKRASNVAKLNRRVMMSLNSSFHLLIIWISRVELNSQLGGLFKFINYPY